MGDIASTAPTAPLESRKDFEDNPRDQYRYWLVELQASEKNLRGFTRQGNEVTKRYLADAPSGSGSSQSIGAGSGSDFKMNLFYANTVTLEATLYGSVPTIDVSRRYADSNDDVGRVAAEVIERLLNSDIAEHGTETESVLRAGLQDRLIVGLGASRVRYTAEFEKVNGEDVMTVEDAVIEYVHWRDVRWGWARNYSDIKWIGFRSYMTKDEAQERFGDKADKLEYKAQQALNEEGGTSSNDNSDAWMKAEVWEIWDKVKRQVVWVSVGFDKVLDTKPDPLQLSGFYPCPPFFIANATTTLYVPTSDYHLVQDLYNEVDKLQTRITIITEAVKVVGVYDGTNGEIARMMKEGTDNDLIPVENWALFAEKGGVQGQIDWFPIAEVVAALVQLVQMRDATLGMLQQVTGMSDLMRGELSNQYEGVGQTQIKAQFGSIRIQALQDQFAQYATDLMQIKAEVIARHFSPETIVRRANAEHLLDKELVAPAVELIKKPSEARLKVVIRPESVAMVDYAALKNERTEYLTALATFMQSAAPLIESDPAAKPFLLQLLQWGLAGFKGASEIEGVIDKAIEASQEAAEEAANNPQPDPQIQVEQMKQQFAMQLEEFKAQSEMQKIQAKAQADTQVRQADMQADMQTNLQEHQADVERINAEMIKTLTETKAKLEADIQKEIVQAKANIAQAQATADAEIEKDLIEHSLELNKEATKTGLKIDEIEASASAKLAEAKTKGVGDGGKTKQ